MKKGLVWLRHDLRIRDNRVLQRALQDCDTVVLLYVFDRKDYETTPWGFPKTGAVRAQFIRECLSDMQHDITEREGALVVQFGDTGEEIQRLHSRFSFDAIYAAAEVTLEEQELEQRVAQIGPPIHLIWNYSLYDREVLPFALEAMPGVFTAFRKKMEKGAIVRAELPAPTVIPAPPGAVSSGIPELEQLGLSPLPADQRAVLPFRGGETAAWERLQHYFWESDALRNYKNTRNGLLGADYSAKFSPWLATGALSPVTVYHQVKKYEQERVKNSSTYWLIFELLWRDFFRFTALKEGRSFFKITREEQPRVQPDFEKWRVGATGQDFVDANMQELWHSGYMSNRGRQNVASYLVKDMGQPWYAGAAWFESQLIDYDVCSNYGNWTYVAGVGNDPRENRYFNVAGQAERYDPKAAYRQHWLQ